MMYDLFRLFDILLQGYALSTLLFLALSLFVAPLKRIRKDYLNRANLLALFLALLVTTLTVINFLEDYPTVRLDAYAYPLYRRQFFTALLTSGLIHLLFLFRRLRQHPAVTILVLLSLNFAPLWERVHLLLVQFYRDYLPSTWAVVPDPSRNLYIALATVSYFALAYLLAKKTGANA